jgi:hypothetical protein
MPTLLAVPMVLLASITPVPVVEAQPPKARAEPITAAVLLRRFRRLLDRLIAAKKENCWYISNTPVLYCVKQLINIANIADYRKFFYPNFLSKSCYWVIVTKKCAIKLKKPGGIFFHQCLQSQLNSSTLVMLIEKKSGFFGFFNRFYAN